VASNQQEVRRGLTRGGGICSGARLGYVSSVITPDDHTTHSRTAQRAAIDRGSGVSVMSNTSKITQICVI